MPNAEFPELCQQTDDNGQGGLRFDIDKNRISIRLTAPYSEDRRRTASELAKKRGIFPLTATVITASWWRNRQA